MKSTKKLPVDNFTKDIARQPSEFTRAVFKGTALAYKLIIFALYKVSTQSSEGDKAEKDMRCVFSASEFFSKLGMTHGSRQGELVERATEELSRSIIVLRNEDARNPNDVSSLKMPWFESVKTLNDGSVHMKFNRAIAEFFDFRVGYTALELLEIGDLQSFYAMRYYGLAKSTMGFSGERGNGRNSWWFEFTEEELRRFFEIENSKYKDRKDFVKTVIKKPCEEVNEKTGVNIDLQYEKISKGKYRWRFLCSLKKTLQEPASPKTKAAKSAEAGGRLEAEEERARVAALKNRHPERWLELLEAEIRKPQPGGMNMFWAEVNAASALLEEFRDDPV